MTTFPSAPSPPPQPPRAAPAARPRRAAKVNRLPRTLKLNYLTFLKSQPTLPVRDVTHHLIPIPIWDFYFDISEWHILPERAWTPALMLHLTNLCAKRKVLNLTKPKGKIYKTKSVGHYITLLVLDSNGWNHLTISKLLKKYCTSPMTSIISLFFTLVLSYRS